MVVATTVNTRGKTREAFITVSFRSHNPHMPTAIVMPDSTTMNRSKSHEIFQRAQELMPGGVNSPARAFGGVGGEPVVFERANGAYLFDVDGNRYIDYIGSWGPMILGHQHPKVVAPVHAAVDRAFTFGAPTAAENE